MKHFFAIIFSIVFLPIMSGQTIATTNSGAVSNNNLIYSVGEIFVIPTNQNNTSSGIIGVVSIIEFFILGIDEIVHSEDLKIYPNPTSNSIFLETNSIIKKVFIYELNGKLVAVKKIYNKQVDLMDLPTGIYLIKPNNSYINSFKIIKK